MHTTEIFKSHEKIPNACAGIPAVALLILTCAMLQFERRFLPESRRWDTKSCRSQGVELCSMLVPLSSLSLAGLNQHSPAASFCIQVCASSCAAVASRVLARALDPSESLSHGVHTRDRDDAKIDRARHSQTARNGATCSTPETKYATAPGFTDRLTSRVDAHGTKSNTFSCPANQWLRITTQVLACAVLGLSGSVVCLAQADSSPHRWLALSWVIPSLICVWLWAATLKHLPRTFTKGEAWVVVLLFVYTGVRALQFQIQCLLRPAFAAASLNTLTTSLRGENGYDNQEGACSPQEQLYRMPLLIILSSATVCFVVATPLAALIRRSQRATSSTWSSKDVSQAMASSKPIHSICNETIPGAELNEAGAHVSPPPSANAGSSNRGFHRCATSQ